MNSAAFTEREYRILENTFLFRGMGRDFIRRVAEDPLCERAFVPKRAVIYRPERFRRSLGVILAGSAQVSKEEGALVIGILPAGSLFGAAALFGGGEYATKITALEPCDLLFLPQPLVTALLRESPDLAENYIRYLSERIRFLSGKIDGLAAGGAERRLAHFLLELSDGASEVGLPCSMTELAARMKLSRASLYRAFEALERSGAVLRKGKTVIFLDRDRLFSEERKFPDEIKKGRMQ